MERKGTSAQKSKEGWMKKVFLFKRSLNFAFRREDGSEFSAGEE
jgi:hypothetical protein